MPCFEVVLSRPTTFHYRITADTREDALAIGLNHPPEPFVTKLAGPVRKEYIVQLDADLDPAPAATARPRTDAQRHYDREYSREYYRKKKEKSLP